MEPECSLPHLKQPATSPHPEPVHAPSYFLKIQFNIIILSIHESVKWSSSLRFFYKNPVCIYPRSHTCYMSRRSPSSFWLPECLSRNTEHEAPRYVVFSTHLLPRVLGPNIPRSTLYSDTLSLRFSFSVRDQVLYPYRTSKIIVLYIWVFI